MAKKEKQSDAMPIGEKRTASPEVEQIRPGPVFSPAVDIFESESEITVLADMPGVTAETLDVDLRDGVLTLEGRVEAPAESQEETVLTEYAAAGTFLRRFTLSDTIDQAKIEASLTNGVLRLTLPKVAKARARQITVKGG